MAYEVTIGIPVYNAEKYIRQTMDSALAQTFQSIEYIVCDDCGSDSSIDIVKDYQQNHPRGKDIRIVRQPCNMGIGEARNRMIDEARGVFFYSLDADDVITPDAIQLLYDAAKKYSAELVYGSYERLYVNEDKRRTVQYPYPFRVFTEPDEYAIYAYNVGVQGMNWNYLISLDVIRKNHLRVTPVGHGYGEDFTFTVDLPTYVTRVVLLPNITYQYFVEEKVFKGKRKKLVSRDQMDKSIAALDRIKHRIELKGRPYFAKRCAKVMMYDYSFASEIIRRRKQINPPYTDCEIRDVMWHPMSLCEIINSDQDRVKNLFTWMLGKISPFLSVIFLWFSVMLKCLISSLNKSKEVIDPI